MYRYDSTFAFPVKGDNGTVQRVRAYDAELLIRNASDGKKYLYDVVNIKENTSAQSDLTERETRSAAMRAATGEDVSDNSIRESAGNVNANLSRKLSAADGGAKLSIKYDDSNTPYVVVEEDILDGVPQSRWVKTVKDNLRRKFPDGVTVGNNVIEINKHSREEMTYSEYTKYLMRTEPELYADKFRATNNADEILRASRNYVNEALAHTRRDNIQEFARGDVLMEIGGNDYSAKVVVAMRSNRKLLLYDILQMEPTRIQVKIRSPARR